MRNFGFITGNDLQVRATLEQRREQIILTVLRNLIPIFGILFLGWSAQNLIVLYFVDTLASIWALITGLAFNLPDFQNATSFGMRLKTLGTVVFVGIFLTGFMAVPMGVPLFIYTQIVDWDWHAALDSQDFIYGLVSIVALSFISMIRLYQDIARVTPDKYDGKSAFGLIFLRWIVVLVILYTVGFLLGPFGAYLLVIGYAAATVASEIFPNRFLAFFDSSRRIRGSSDLTAANGGTVQAQDLQASPIKTSKRKGKNHSAK